MKTKFWTVGLACLLVFCVAPASALAGTISGTITADGGGPIEGSVSICAEPEVGSGSCEVVTEEGEYTLSAPEGEYRVSFSSVGGNEYVSQYWQGSSNFQGATVVDLDEEGEVTGIDADLVSGSSVSGTIVGTDGEPIYQAHACVHRVGGNGGVNCAITNEEGEYSITSIAPDTYKLYFEEGFSGPEYVTNYYPEKATEAEAEVLTIGGKEARTANATLASAGRIEGNLTGEGQAPSFGEICAYKLDGTKVDCGFAVEEPDYAIRRLAAGSYVLKFESNGFQTEYSGGASTFAAATPVTVVAGGATTANADLTGEPAIRGTVTDALTAEPAEGVLVCAETSSGPAGCASSDVTGKYSVPVAPGTYQVSFSEFEYVTQYYDGVTDPADSTPVTVGDAPRAGIDAALEEAGTIKGTVTSSDGNTGLGGVEICALSGSGGEECRFTENDGTYEISSLAPGAYKVRFVLGGYFTQYFAGKTTAAEAEAVTVTAKGVTEGVDATLAAEEEPTNITPPVVSGVGKVGETLSCSDGVWSGNPPNFTYEYFWFRGEDEIEGAESNTYRLEEADAGEEISCAVVVTNSVGTEYEFSSNSIVVSAIQFFTLTVGKSGDGTGTVASEPGTIGCGAICADTFKEGTTITLFAIGDSGSEFTGWSGACSGDNACVVTLGADTTVVATFAKKASDNGGGSSTPPSTLPSGSTPPASTPPAPPATTKPAPKHDKKKPLRCKKGFRKAKLKGKVRCVKPKPKHKGGKAKGRRG